MECYFDMFGKNIIPEGVLGHEWEKTKEDVFASVVDKLTMAFTRRMDPDMAAKGAEVKPFGFDAM
jgi:hypothetical protein